MTDEEIAEVKSIIVKLKEEKKALEGSQGEISVKVNWLKELDAIDRKVINAEKAEKAAKETAGSKEMEERKHLIVRWENSADIRTSLNEMDKAEEQEKKIADDLLSLETTYRQLKAGYSWLVRKIAELPAIKEKKEEADKELRNITATVESLEKELEAKDLPGLHKREKELQDLVAKINTAIEAVMNLSARTAEQAEAKKQIDELEKIITGLEKLMPDLNKAASEAKAEMDKAEEVRNTLSGTIKEWTRELRSKLKEGDSCPVCGQKISGSLPGEETLKKAYDEAEFKYRESKRIHAEKSGEAIKCETQFTESIKQLSLRKEAYRLNTAVQKAQEALEHAVKECGMDYESISDDLAPALKTAKESSLREKEGIVKKIGDATEIEVRRKAAGADKVRSEKIVKELEQKLNAVNIYRTHIENVTPILNTIHDRMPQWEEMNVSGEREIDGLTIKMSDLNAKLKSKMDALKSARETTGVKKSVIAQYLAANPDVTIGSLRYLNGFTSEMIQRQRINIEEVKNNLIRCEESLKIARKEKEEHLGKMPLFEDSDSYESLEKQFGDNERTKSEISNSIGRLEKGLEDNELKIKSKEESIKDFENKSREFDKWHYMSIQLKMGDANGKHFCTIAQSYVLSHLISMANVHLKKLSDRYTLGVKPNTEFVIYIEDAYQGYARRSVSTISGGETFLVSLALALALSDIGSAFSVNTLFIDEGFGTLSGEPLQSAIETLRNLHWTSGRKVGIISHKEELLEKIPVQIKVEQEGRSSSSKVKVVTV